MHTLRHFCLTITQRHFNLLYRDPTESERLLKELLEPLQAIRLMKGKQYMEGKEEVVETKEQMHCWDLVTEGWTIPYEVPVSAPFVVSEVPLRMDGTKGVTVNDLGQMEARR